MDYQEMSPQREELEISPSRVIKPQKTVSIIISKKEDSFGDISVKPLASVDLHDLHTCVPYHLEGKGLLVNDIPDDVPKCDAYEPSDFPTPLHAPSDDFLFRAPHATRQSGTNSSRIPVGINTQLTVEQLKAGLKNIARVGNGYHINYSHLDLSNQNLVDISTISSFSSLASIDISGNYIQSVDVFGFMPYLRVVNASRNDLEVFGEFQAPVALEQVNFSRNRIKTLVNLEKFWALVEVNLSHNELTTAEGFENCRHLRVLDLSHNKISNIENLCCPSLVALFLHNNNIEVILNLDGCPNLRALSLAQNRIENLQPLRYQSKLNELWLQENRIKDIMELEHLKPLLNLSSLFIDPNPMTYVGIWRSMVIFTLPQIQVLDRKTVKLEESVHAENTFHPTHQKVAFENRMAVMLDRACQAANIAFDDSVYKSSLPPLLLLVGAPMSRCYRLAVLLKEKYRTKVQLGGVHSTATTLEFPNTNKDVPVSIEGFLGMKQRGEFLAFSHILGRICGFATSQITRAYERNAILVAAVPLGIALSLSKWKLKSKMVLVMPTDRVENLKLDAEIPQQPSVLEDELPPDDSDEDEIDRSIADTMQNEKRKRAPSISFAREEKTFDLDHMGTKRPSLEPATGPGVLRSLHPDGMQVPDLPEPYLDMVNEASINTGMSSLEVRSDSFFLGRSKSGAAMPMRPSTIALVVPTLPFGETDLETTGTSINKPSGQQLHQAASDTEAMLAARRSSPEQIRHIFSAGSTLRNSDEMERDNTTMTENPQTSDVSSAPPFTTEGTAAPARFSTLNQMNKLRRIASLFLQLGGSNNLTDVFREFPPEFDLNMSMRNLNWTETLLDIDAPKCPTSDHVYHMLFNKCNLNLQQLESSGPEAAKVLENLRKCCAKTKQGAYELLFLKTSVLNDMKALSAGGKDATNMDDMTCGGVQGRLFGNYQIRPSHLRLEGDHVPSDSVAMTANISQNGGSDRIPSKLLGLRSPGDRSELSTPDTAVVPSNQGTSPAESDTPAGPLGQDEACRVVVNPNYAFGPHEVCCSKRISRPLTDQACGGIDVERGTFFDGNFQQNFLDSRSVSDTVLDDVQNELLQPEDMEDETRGEDGFEQPQVRVHHCNSAPFQAESEEYIEEEYEGEDGANMQSAPPPSVDDSSKYTSRSRYSSSKSARQSSGNRTGTSTAEITADEETTDSVSETISVTSITEGHHKRKLRQVASIMNSRKEYAEFHDQNPGFFHTVIDSENLKKCVASLSQVLEEVIEDFKNQKPTKSPSYSAGNVVDTPNFLNQRMNEYRQLSSGFSKGISQRATVAMACKPKKDSMNSSIPQHLNFEKSKCPANLLEPKINRKPRNTKIKRIIQNEQLWQ